MRFSQVEDVIVGEVPLTIAGSVKDGDCAVGKSSHHSPFHVAENEKIKRF